MYNHFFGFKSKPFKLVPDPEFLFLGKSHEEALAHLTYATTEGEGFTEITGEVGTGKTTLCRVFLENLGDDIETAFIFNSKLSAVQLLKTILGELDIDCHSDDPSDMTAALYDFLLDKKVQGKSVVLLIDEAQNLGMETLEQLRLLSNLETTRSKLLQIILVGQPELSDILDSYEMRQLRQRINLSCRIFPMELKETREYIGHRIQIACGTAKKLFTPDACKLIHQYAKGIPRLINIACDRSLLAAYSKNLTTVNLKTAGAAVRELKKRKTVQDVRIFNRPAHCIALFTLLFTLFFALLIVNIPVLNQAGHFRTQKQTQPEQPLEKQRQKLSPQHSPVVPPLNSIAKFNKTPVKPHESVKDTSTVGSLKVENTPVKVIGQNDVAPYLERIMGTVTRKQALLAMISLWREKNGQTTGRITATMDELESDAAFFQAGAAQNGLNLLRLKDGIDSVLRFNLPAVLVFNLNEEHGYLVLTGLTRTRQVDVFPGQNGHRVRVPAHLLDPFLADHMYVAWKNHFGYDGLISQKTPGAVLISLKLALRESGFPMDLSPVYDSRVIDAVKQVQKEFGLHPDGLVGPMTKIILARKQHIASFPWLTGSED